MPLDKKKNPPSKGTLIPALRYAWLTTKHKYFVFMAGLKVGCPIWRLLTHDLSKYGPHELVHYGRRFFGKGGKDLNFARAWNHHQNRNSHHWEYHMQRTKHDQDPLEYKILPMSENDILEMISDWFGASRAYDGKWPVNGKWPWFDKNFDKMVLHPDTRKRVLEILEDLSDERSRS